jgi:hypothetical protein
MNNTKYHPTQFETPVSRINNTSEPNQSYSYYPSIDTTYQKNIGRNINKAFYITVIFLLLSNGYTFLNNVYFLWSNQNIVIDENNIPTTKGYLFMSIIFFVATFIVLRKR